MRLVLTLRPSGLPCWFVRARRVLPQAFAGADPRRAPTSARTGTRPAPGSFFADGWQKAKERTTRIPRGRTWRRCRMQNSSPRIVSSRGRPPRARSFRTFRRRPGDRRSRQGDGPATARQVRRSFSCRIGRFLSQRGRGGRDVPHADLPTLTKACERKCGLVLVDGSGRLRSSTVVPPCPQKTPPP